MREIVEPATHNGRPLAAYRNVPAEHFYDPDPDPDPDLDRSVPPIENPIYIYEGISQQFPEPDDQVPPTISPTYTQRREYSHEYKTETGELGDKTLPIYPYRNEIRKAVRDNRVVIISADTGAGKSTQLPLFLSEDEQWDEITLTQPRRVAARNVYERISDEAGRSCGMDTGEFIGFQTATELRGSRNARIRIVTDGLQVAKEYNQSGIVKGNRVLIIDEFHEANSNMEMLFGWALEELKKDPNLRLVLMSATFKIAETANFVHDVIGEMPQIIHVSGRTFPVERREAPNSTAAIETVKIARKIARLSEEEREGKNGILVIVPGKKDIKDVINEISERLPSDVRNKATILEFHSELSPEEQQLVMKSYPGVKIIVSTNISQTSMTIPDLYAVVDTGLHKQKELDKEGTQGLKLRPASQADCDQRAGRVGRTMPGLYILTRLNRNTPFVPYISRAKYPVAEILRTDLVRNTLRAAGAGINIRKLPLLSRVKKSSIKQAQGTLQILGALDKHNNITNLGARMNEFPVGAAYGRMMADASRLNERSRACMAAIVAAKEVGGLQAIGSRSGSKWKEFVENTTSDLLGQLEIFIAIQTMDLREIKDYDLNVRKVVQAREQFKKIARKVGVRPEVLDTPSADELKELRACIYAGLITSAYRHIGKGLYQHIGPSKIPRKISDGSIVKPGAEVIFGEPYRFEVPDRSKANPNGVKDVHVIQFATAATLRDVGKAAVGLLKPGTREFIMRRRGIVEKTRLTLFGVDIGLTQETPAEPSRKLESILVDNMLRNPGRHQKELRNLRNELQALAHMAKDPVPQLTHAEFIEIIHRSATGVSSLIEADIAIGEIMRAGSITLEKYVSAERQKHISENSPPSIEVAGTTLSLRYENSRPIARKYDPIAVQRIKEDVFLPDGRLVLFTFNGQKLPLHQVHWKLEYEARHKH